MKQNYQNVTEIIDETTGELTALVLKGITFKRGDKVILKDRDKTKKEYGTYDKNILATERLGKIVSMTPANLGYSNEMEEWAQMGAVFEIKELKLIPKLYSPMLKGLVDDYTYTLAMIQHVEKKSEDFWEGLEVL